MTENLEKMIIDYFEEILNNNKNYLIKYHTNTDKIDGILSMYKSTLLSLRQLKKELKHE